jgi:putative transposase
MNKKYLADFYDGGIFHVYNRTNNKELLFRTEENRRYFLRQYSKYLYPFLDTFCWSLLPNHFHFLVRVKEVEKIKTYLVELSPQLIQPLEKRYLKDQIAMELLIEFEWKRFFISYAMNINRQFQRKGNFFYRPFKRLEILKENHFTQANIYIHTNAQRHLLCKDFSSYPWSSWHTMTSSQPTQLCRQEVLDWFGGLQPFMDAHKNGIADFDCSEVEIEEG